ncbi:MAG: ACT domain-containing protein [Candidatus Omnitrophica bacterium]|nr:ACT domain-containing protein [Candidatus Omnitrophota bacterium]
MAQSVVTVTGLDRPGIIAEITGILYKAGANLQDVSMTILGGQLAMVLIVDTRGKEAEAAVKNSCALLESSGLSVSWRNLKRDVKSARPKHERRTQTLMLTAAGADRTGIVYGLSEFFSKRKMNITDLNCKILPGRGRAIYVAALEVDVPQGRAPAEKLQKELTLLGRRMHVDIKIRPVEQLEL